MKRFWVFVIICIVALGIGFTVYRFTTKEELIAVNQMVYEINAGDTITLDITEKNLKAGTKVTAVSSDAKVMSDVSVDSEFKFLANIGGTTTITVSSNASWYTPQVIVVYVGDGINTPFFIKTSDQLKKIGVADDDGNVKYKLSSNYKLTGNISDLTDWTPIANGVDSGFTGTFDFNGMTISNLSMSKSEGISSAGLFAKIGESGLIKSAVVKNFTFTGNYDYVGAIAGQNYGKIYYADATNISITDAKENANVGGIVGFNSSVIVKTKITDSSVAANGNGASAGGIAGVNKITTIGGDVSISVSYAICSVIGSYSAGGIVGQNIGARIENCYAGKIGDTSTVSGKNSLSYVGGIVGYVTFTSIGESSTIVSSVADCYSVITVTNTGVCGAVIGKNINKSETTGNYNTLFGLYYSTEINTGMSGISGRADDTIKGTSFGIYSKTISELESETSTYFSFYADDGTTECTWQFGTIWEMHVGENVMPTLYMEGSNTGSRVNNFKERLTIYNQDDFFKMKGSSELYKLGANITISFDSTHQPFDLIGSLSCPTDASGNAIYTITLNVTGNSGLTNDCVALFKSISSSSKLENLKVVVDISGVTVNNIAGLVVENNGTISKCDVSGSITTDDSSGVKYIAGVVAKNNSAIDSCKSSVKITFSKVCTFVYAGGVCAFNSQVASISNCSNLKDGTLNISGICQKYVGGIVGDSEGMVEKCYNYSEITTETDTDASKISGDYKTYVGGIVGALSVDGISSSNNVVRYCANYGTIRGYNVGGVVGYSQGFISYCLCSANLNGIYVGGLVNKIKYNSMKYSYTQNCSLYGESEGSVIAGAVYSIDVTEKHTAYCQNIFTCCEYGGMGKKYYESSSNIRGDSADTRICAVDDNAFLNSIHVERSGNIIRNDGNFDGWNGYIGSHSVHDTQITDEQAKGSEDFSIFKDNGYSTQYWNFTKGSYPTLIGIKK